MDFNKKYKWCWCSHCMCSMIVCLKCGNPTCNGCYGEVDGKQCNMCKQAYQYTKEGYKKPLKYKIYEFIYDCYFRIRYFRALKNP